MSERQRLRSLGRLVDLQSREVYRLTADVAEKRVTRERYVRNLTKLETLRDSSGPVAGLPALSLNRAGYKQAMMRMVATHRLDLSLHDSQLALTQRELIDAARRHEALGQVLQREHSNVLHVTKVQEQKQQDEMASQVWWRNK
ncbi:flagellar FliJ family protein [Steroidobacter sp.]|uniref:flagellar FliJ family protein n=1 Tax=Steroidobacter sp. TaxID=1978227 RepID=UPI001A5EFF1C|nr:flagellar FliJ family protein [Steroidobacter sp.]MBL8265471.1 flagellar FliJ family protein [Steroidobacter sp.]